MAQGIQAGSIYYTVGIDRASLQRVRSEIQQLGKAAGQTSGGTKRAGTALQELSSRSRELANRLRTLQSEMKEQGGTSENYRAGFEKVHNEAIQLRGALGNLKGQIGSTAAEQAEFHGVMARTASVLQKSAAVTGSARTQYDALGSEFEQMSHESDRLASALVQLEHRHDAGKVNTNEYAASLRGIRSSAEGFENQLLELQKRLNLTDKEYRQLTKTMQRFTGMQARASKRITAATGKFNSMATATKLSYGATTLLNDRIFQLSPALGILTNQLIFTTEGLKAFLRAAAPIVAVGGAIVGTIYGIARSLTAGVGLEDALADVRKTTGLTSDELKQLTTTFQELSHEIPITTEEMLETARVAGQLGIRGVDNIAQFTQAISELGVATDVVGEQGATSLARFLSATDTSLEEMGSEAIRVSNILNELENTTAATASQILQMTTFTQGLGAQAGFSRAEILAMNAALQSVGVRPQAGSAVLRTISDIQTAASEGGEALENFAEASSVSLEQFEDMARNSPVDAFMALAEGMNESSRVGANLNDILADIGVVEVRERRALLGLVQGYDRLSDAMDTARAQAILQDSIQEEVAIQSDKVSARITVLGNRFTTMAQNIGTSLKPALRGLIDTLIALVDNLDLVAGALTGSLLLLSGPSIVNGLGKLVVAMRGVTATAWTMVSSFWGLQYAWLALRTSLVALITGPVGIAALGAALGTGLVIGLRNTKEETWDAEEALEAYETRVRDVTALFSRVKTKNDLVIALNAVSDTLTGPGKDGWDQYKDKIIESIDEVENLSELTDDVIQKFLDLQVAPFQAREAMVMSNLAQTFGTLASGPFREEFSGVSLKPGNLDAVLERAREIEETLRSTTQAGPADAEGLLRQQNLIGELIQNLEDAKEATEALEEAERKRQQSLESLGLGGEGEGGGDGGVDVSDLESQYDEALEKLHSTFQNLSINRDTGVIEDEEEFYNARISALRGFVEEANSIIVDIRSQADHLGNLDPALESLLQKIIRERDHRLNTLQGAREYLEGLEKDPVDPLTIENAETVQEMFDALRREGTKLAGAPASLMAESLEARKSLIQTALEKALDMEDITDDQVQYLQKRLDELQLQLDLEQGNIPEFLQDGSRPGPGGPSPEDFAQVPRTPGEERRGMTPEQRDELRRVLLEKAARLDAMTIEEWMEEMNISPTERSRNERGLSPEDRSDLNHALAEQAAALAAMSIEEWMQEMNISPNERARNERGISPEERDELNHALAQHESELAAMSIEDWMKEMNISPNERARNERGLSPEERDELNQALAQKESELASMPIEDWMQEMNISPNEQARTEMGLTPDERDNLQQALAEKTVELANMSIEEWMREMGISPTEQTRMEGGISPEERKSIVEGGIELDRGLSELSNSLEMFEDRADALSLGVVDRLNEQIAIHERHLDNLIDKYGANSEEVAIVTSRLEGLREQLAVTDARMNLSLQAAQRATVGATSFREAWMLYNQNVGPVTGDILEYLKKMFDETDDEVSDTVKTLGEMSDMFGGIANATDNLVSKLANFASSATEGIGSIVEGAENFANATDLLDESNEEAWGTVMGGISNVLGGLDELLPQYDSTANQMVEGAFAAAGAIAEIAIPIPGIGQAISALGSVVSSVFGDMSNGAKQVKESLEDAADSSELLLESTVLSFREIEGVVERVSRNGFLGGVLGLKKDELQQEMFDYVMGIAEGVAGGLQSALGSAIEAAMSGDQNWKQAFRENFESAILDVIMETFIQAAVLGEEFQAFIEEFTKRLAEGGPEAAFEYFEDEFESVINNAERVADEWMEHLPDRFKEGTDQAVEHTEENIDRIVDSVTSAESIVNEAMARMFIDAATEDGEINQRMVNRMVSLANSVAGGMESGLRQGINAFLRGDDDWAQQLEDGVTSAVTNALINAFIASAAVQDIMADFIDGFVMAFEESPQAAAEYAKKNVQATIDQMASMVSTFVNNIPDELLPSSNRRSTRYEPPEREPSPEPESQPRAAGTNISEITGPTRDLLTDLLRPLSIMPSWTSMIRDIRNDVRMIATNGGMSVPQIQGTPTAMRAGITNNTVNIQNATITTQATDAKGLWRAISRWSFKERRGGK